MPSSDFIEEAQKLVAFCETRHFEPVTQRTPYNHIGATITDSVLQAGLNYKYVVYPRVLRLLTEFSYYRTTCDFLILMQTIPLSKLIDWNNEKKLSLIGNISWLLYNSKVETESQLAIWLKNTANKQRLLQMNGVGPKTIDYLTMLSGSQAIAIDRHLFSFLRLAGVVTDSYQDASEIYHRAANMLQMSEYELDRKIWLYMTKLKA